MKANKLEIIVNKIKENYGKSDKYSFLLKELIIYSKKLPLNELNKQQESKFKKDKQLLGNVFIWKLDENNYFNSMKFPLKEGETVLGKANNCHIVINDDG